MRGFKCGHFQLKSINIRSNLATSLKPLQPSPLKLHRDAHLVISYLFLISLSLSPSLFLLLYIHVALF